MKNVSLLISALLICFFITGVNAQKTITTTRQVSGFKAVSISGGVDLYITQGAKESVKIEASEDFQKYVITKIVNGTLEIYVEHGRDLGNVISNLFRGKSLTNKLNAYVTMPELNNLTASGGSDVYGQNNIKISELKMDASGGSDIKIEVTGAKLDCVATGGSDLTLKGKVAVLSTHSSGGSDIKAYELQADKAVVTCSGGSDVSVTVTTELNANASGGSDIYYKGNPVKSNKNSSGGSDIIRKN